MTASSRVRSTRAQLIEDAQRRGVTRLEWETCGYRHPVTRVGLGCNAASLTVDGDACEGWNLREVRNPGDEVTVTRAKAGTL